ncbi:hypothetical protein PTKIN_Ptkin13bG0192500 [Pterospermum kingtungense]
MATRTSNGDWPADMLSEILSKLPIKSILRFKCVAKTWCILSKNPNFVSKHLSLSKKNNYLLVEYHDRNNQDKYGMRLLDYQTLVPYHDLRHHLPNHLTDMYFSFSVYDGLFCLLHGNTSGITLWNPATRESRVLPECDHDIIPKLQNCQHVVGFGLDPLSNDYKVIYIRTSDGDREGKYRRLRHHGIYRLSTDSWRVLEEEDVEFVKQLHIFPNYNNTCVNGVYYWQVCQIGLSEYKVLAFDLSTEVFRLIESPISALGKLLPLHDGCISIWDTERVERSNEIWVLNDDGNWNKLFKIEPLSEVERIFGFWKNEKVFVESKSGQLLLYDIDTEELTDFGIKASAAGDLHVYSYEESLVSIGRE